tara:strand:+ start:228 stop:428 length:201 start_codon:yes stop_codon:yes gene_type:complete
MIQKGNISEIDTYRFIQNNKDKLTDHEIYELKEDFRINTENFYVLACLKKDEWETIKTKRKDKMTK